MLLLENISWRDAGKYFREHDLAILPIGSVEQHGPHNPLGTDFLIAEELAKELSKRTNVLVLPTVAYGVSFHHSNFPGTISIDEEVFAQYIYNIMVSLSKNGVKKVLVINGHGGNYYPLMRVSRLARMNLKMLVYIFQWWTAISGKMVVFRKEEEGHAGAEETSLISYLKPGLVDMNICEDEKSVGTPISNYFIYTDEMTENGVYGISCTASREKGKLVFDKILDILVEVIEDLKKTNVE